MNNKDIAYAFDELANLMELHDEAGFRIKTYRNAYLLIRKLEQPLLEMSAEEMQAMKGIGKATADKVRSLLSTGSMPALEQYRQQTPAGVVEMLEIGGLGPKKVRSVWKEMGIETVGELHYACLENRLAGLSGFGLKTQEDVRRKIDFYLLTKGKIHLDTAESEAAVALRLLGSQFPEARFRVVGELGRSLPLIENLALLTDRRPTERAFEGHAHLQELSRTEDWIDLQMKQGTAFRLHCCAPDHFGNRYLELTSHPDFYAALQDKYPEALREAANEDTDIFSRIQLPYVVPELRENAEILQRAEKGNMPTLINDADIKGVLHVHTTWSDGLHDLEAMCRYAQQLGYLYIGITDHSKSAFYANGLSADRLKAQMEAIDRLNEQLSPFRIFKGIESDILHDGSLDYEDALLEQLDFVIASVHSNLKMNREKATARVLAAIQHPCTTLLGHPTGRLLLSREGYPLDWDQVLDACDRHAVGIELNANPWRLDLDWTLIQPALNYGIPIAINPDAHSKEGYDHLRYGVRIARKGGLQAEGCVNYLSVDGFAQYSGKRR
jgi:DNA polymerase (family 10)